MPTVLAKPTQPAAPITPGAAPVAAPGATSTTMNEQQKKIFIIVGAVAGFLVLFGIVYGVLSSAVFSAKSVANSYVAAISSGNYDKANTIADPHVNTNQRALLTSKASSGENTRITNARISQTSNNADGTVSGSKLSDWAGKDWTWVEADISSFQMPVDVARGYTVRVVSAQNCTKKKVAFTL